MYYDGEVKETFDNPIANGSQKPSLKIISATYGPKNILDVLLQKYKNGTRRFEASNGTWGDP